MPLNGSSICFNSSQWTWSVIRLLHRPSKLGRLLSRCWHCFHIESVTQIGGTFLCGASGSPDLAWYSSLSIGVKPCKKNQFQALVKSNCLMSVYFYLFKVKFSNIVYPVSFKMKQFFFFTSHIPRIRNESHIISDRVLIDTFQIAKYYRFTQIFTNFVTQPSSQINGVTSEDQSIHVFIHISHWIYHHVLVALFHPSC